MIAKILIGILGILFIFAIIWFGMPNVQNVFKEVKMISITGMMPVSVVPPNL